MRMLISFVLLVTALTADAAPILLEPPEIPPEFRYDLIFTGTVLATQIPIEPRGRGTALAHSSLEGVDPTYGATEEFYPANPDDGASVRELTPRAGLIVVPHLDPRTRPTVHVGSGARGIDESVPRSIVRRKEDGSTTRMPVAEKGSAATTGVGEATSDTRGVLAYGKGGWLVERDNDPQQAGNQGVLYNVHLGLIGRSQDGPKKDVIVADLSEHRITGMPSGTVSLAPKITTVLTTTLGLPESPKPGRFANVVFAYEGIGSFTRDPLWSLTLEYTPEGRLLSRFMSSNLLRDATDPLKGLDDAAILAEVREKIGVDSVGRLSNAGFFGIPDLMLFDAQVTRRVSWDYTQRVVTYMRLAVPEPGTLLLVLAAVAAIALARRPPCGQAG